ncbi:hypothetical protein NLJ89_g7484 [Agrocybe chaxingu]|uniref:BTB domain-containing protein n=1 Tax=Agrocybe chaxingu TaxID=84603 RepID=A0A9W8JWR2_9AGAR|nr:hypothetical protein NLJ89_g7484 [Agrocybe chaxingu]
MSHQSTDRPSGISFPNRHDKYYIDGADLHVLVGRRDKTLFRVHGYFFSRESKAFDRKNKGQTDNDPVTLDDVSPEEFEKLLWVFYNPRYSIYEASIGDWTDILNLANKWSFPEVKELAVRELQKKPEIDLVNRVVLYRKFNVHPRHVVPLYAQLCSRPIPLSEQESNILGLEATLLIMTAREKLRSNPSDGGLSPLPRGTEENDIIRALKATKLNIQAGSTTNSGNKSPTSSPTSDPKPNGPSNQNTGQGGAGPSGGNKPTVNGKPGK